MDPERTQQISDGLRHLAGDADPAMQDSPPHVAMRMRVNGAPWHVIAAETGLSEQAAFEAVQGILIQSARTLAAQALHEPACWAVLSALAEEFAARPALTSPSDDVLIGEVR